MSSSPTATTVTPITSLPEFFDIINGDKIAFIEFWAPWCESCKAVKPLYEGLSSTHDAVAKFYSLDIDQHDDISHEVRVTSIPTIIAFKDGSPLGTVVGAERGPLFAFVAKHAPVN